MPLLIFALLNTDIAAEECDTETSSAQAATLRLNVAMKTEL
ncbi:MAG TPA: hypothetical protein PLP23_02695 [Panacibacter sp.]|nr:hypothetical protein [Panacibacter sp.]